MPELEEESWDDVVQDHLSDGDDSDYTSEKLVSYCLL